MVCSNCERKWQGTFELRESGVHYEVSGVRESGRGDI